MIFENSVTNFQRTQSELEKLFLEEYQIYQDQFSNLADFDLSIWKAVKEAKGLAHYS